MKYQNKIIALFLFVFALLLLSMTYRAVAQDAATPAAVVTSLDPAAPNPLQSTIDGLLGKFGWLTTVLLAVGAFRLLFKPIFTAWHWWVEQTASSGDDAVLAKVESSSIVKGICFVLDYVGSIKLKK